MKWYLKVLKQYADFQGRARRQEYWMFFLLNVVFCVLAMIIDNAMGLTIGDMGYGPIYIVYGLFVFIPGISAAVRRLHDIDKSGWMLLVSFIPIVGAIWLIVLLATDSNPGDNQYGSNPKEVEYQG